MKLHTQFCDWWTKALMSLLRRSFLVILRLIQGNVMYSHFKYCKLCISVSAFTVLYLCKARSWSLAVLLISQIYSIFREIWHSMYLDYSGHRKWGNCSAYSLLERNALPWIKEYYFFKSWFLDSASVMTDWEVNFNIL